MARYHKEKSRDVARFSKLWWLNSLRNFFWVLLVTVLIWVYADMEFTDTVKLRATLELNTGESTQYELLSKKDISLDFEISGSRSSLEEFERELSTKGKVLKYDVSHTYTTGQKIVLGTKLLDAAAGLSEKGISIKSVQPETIEVDMDIIVSLDDIPVEFKATGATFEPPVAQKVSIQVTSKRLQEIKKKLNGNPYMLTTKQVDLSGRQPGPAVKIEAEIFPQIEGIKVAPNPKTVTFDVHITGRAATKEITVSVQLLAPASWAEGDWQKFVLVRKDPAGWRVTLDIQGPNKNLKPENVSAYIQLTEDDKKHTTSWLEREVKVYFPPGTGLKLESARPKLSFRLEKRKPAVPKP